MKKKKRIMIVKTKSILTSVAPVLKTHHLTNGNATAAAHHTNQKKRATHAVWDAISGSVCMMRKSANQRHTRSILEARRMMAICVLRASRSSSAGNRYRKDKKTQKK